MKVITTISTRRPLLQRETTSTLNLGMITIHSMQNLEQNYPQ